MGEQQTIEVVRCLIRAIESRDLAAIGDHLSAEVTWQNDAHDSAIGRHAVLKMLGAVVRLADRVEWPIRSVAASGSTVFVERVDRFWIDGECHSVACNGVFEVDPVAAVVVSVRDYMNLGEWRARIDPVIARRRSESAEATVQRHLDAVGRSDPISMAADYASDAVLSRGSDFYSGIAAISSYFKSVAGRLGDRTLTLDSPTLQNDGTVLVTWQIRAASGPGGVEVSGTDIYALEPGCIVAQTVVLDDGDF